MKKQNLNSKLAFNKLAVTELNDNVMYDVNGGITPPISFFYPSILVLTVASIFVGPSITTVL